MGPMVEPAWFFSTLAQSAAAVIAFTIAFASVLFNSRVESLQTSTDELRQEFVKLNEKYPEVLRSMAFTLREAGEFDDPRDIDGPELINQYGTAQAAALIQRETQRLEMTSEEIEAWANDQANPIAARTWAHLLRTAGFLNEIMDLTGNLLDLSKVQQLRESADELNEVLDTNDSTEDLYEELTENSVERGYHTDAIFDVPETMAHWLNKYMPLIDERRKGWPDLQDTTDGTNLVSYTIVVDELKRDIYNLIQKVPGTKLMPSPDPISAVKRLLLITFGLGVTGILFPLMFLISPSDTLHISLELFHIQAAQILLTAGSVLFTALLFRELYNFITQRAKDI